MDKRITKILCLSISCFLFLLFCSKEKKYPSYLTVKIPAQLLSKDFQSGIDKIISEKTKKIFKIDFVKNISEWIFKNFHDPIATTELRYTTLEVTNYQFPVLRELVNDICEVLHINKKIDVFIYPSEEMNAFVTNLDNPCIVLSSALIDYMPRDELVFIIGQELGHVKCEHVLIQVIFQLVQKSLKEASFIERRTIESLVNIGFLKYLRTSEEMADRTGLIACQDIEIAERALLRLLCGERNSNFHEKININEYLLNIEENINKENILASLRMKFILFHQAHPFIPSRMLKLRSYYKSKLYKSLFKDIKKEITYNLQK